MIACLHTEAMGGEKAESWRAHESYQTRVAILTK